MLYTQNMKELTIPQYLVTDKTKHYSFIVGKGEYYISAFEDLSNNLTYDEGGKSRILWQTNSNNSY